VKQRIASMMRFVDSVFDEPRSLRAAALLRILIGPVVLLHLWPFVSEMLQGRYYADAFYSPWVAFMPEPGKSLYFAMLWACVGSAVMLTLGVLTRFASLYTFGFVAYNFFLSQTHFHNNRAFLLINLGCLALTPSGRLLSVDAWRAGRDSRRDEFAPLWPLYLLRLEAVAVYLASGGSKLLDVDWRGGVVTWDRVMRFLPLLQASIAPQWLIALVTQQGFHAVFAKIAIATEIGIAFGLLWRRTRYGAIWVALMFHIVIGVALAVEVFSYLAMSALLVWATPRTRDRTLEIDCSDAAGRRLDRCVRRLDWLARFAVTHASPGQAARVTLIDRDGRRLHGGDAVLFALSRCPALFPLVGPCLLPGVRVVAARLLAPHFQSAAVRSPSTRAP
jgi:uncharacterized membrane protein YphA (DoxX/SURF4 family)